MLSVPTVSKLIILMVNEISPNPRKHNSCTG